MRIAVSGRHHPVPEALRGYASDKAAKLTRVFDRIQSIELVFDVEGGQPAVELIVGVEHSKPFVTRWVEPDAQTAVDRAVGHMEEQLRRHKERLRNRKHPAPPPPLSEQGL
jgi:putative sigma-54 modulation protein